MTRKNYYFFALTDPRDQEQQIRYIGSTTENLNIRLSKMISSAIARERDYKVYEWIRDLFDHDLRPRIYPLLNTEKISEDEEAQIHKRLIEEHKAKGNCDLNMTEGRGTIGHSYEMTEEVKENIAEGVKKDLPLEVIAMMRDDNASWRDIAKALGVSVSTLNKRKEEIAQYIANRPKPIDDEENQ